MSCARLYNCVRCQIHVAICSHCDHGNIYCDTGCSVAARKQKQKEANKRYCSSPQGKLANAERQKRYRQRLRARSQSPAKTDKKEKVTYQGSPSLVVNVLLPPVSRKSNKNLAVYSDSTGTVIHCHFCARVCSPYVRLGSLRNFRSRLSPARNLSG